MTAARTLTASDLAALLDAKQVAESLRVQPNAVAKMARRGVLPIAGRTPRVAPEHVRQDGSLAEDPPG